MARKAKRAPRRPRPPHSRARPRRVHETGVPDEMTITAEFYELRVDAANEEATDALLEALRKHHDAPEPAPPSPSFPRRIVPPPILPPRSSSMGDL